MKKLKCFLLLLCSTLCLTACQVEVHWFGHSTYVPWYVVLIPSIFIIVLATVIVQVCICKTDYKCPKCGRVFRPKWYEFSATIHINSDRLMKCPKCGRKGFCKKDE